MSKNQKYEETLDVDPDKENISYEIATDLDNFIKSGIRISIENATINYENNVLQIDDYDKDVIVRVQSGVCEGSTITYKLRKQSDMQIGYIIIGSYCSSIG